jgi:crossover junction endodeoxyribonuclease RuvC
VEAKKMEMLAMGVIDLQKVGDTYEKLEKIFTRLVSLIDEFKPEHLAIEAPFFGKNVQSMLKLGRAQGVAIAAALSRNLSVNEYAPRKIKMAITGNGSASKEQVAGMLKNILQLKDMPQYMDATDALGVAVCHHYEMSSPLTGISGGAKSWKEFIAKNPNRIT